MANPNMYPDVNQDQQLAESRMNKRTVLHLPNKLYPYRIYFFLMGHRLKLKN